MFRYYHFDKWEELELYIILLKRRENKWIVNWMNELDSSVEPNSAVLNR